jgi:glucose/arabinose dehydrogenase
MTSVGDWLDSNLKKHATARQMKFWLLCRVASPISMKSNSLPGGIIHPLKVALNIVALASSLASAGEVPFTLQGPGVDPKNFDVTIFASGLGFPVGMAEFSDGSILVAVNEGSNFLSTTGKLIRLRDADEDGVADGPPQTMFAGLPGSQTAVRIVDDLVFVVGSAKPLTILRIGDTLDDELIEIGRIDFAYPGNDYHAHSTLQVRPTPDTDRSYELYFQLGSNFNDESSTRTVPISSASIQGVDATLVGDSAYRITITDHGTHLSASEPLRIAVGLRNAAGFAFHPATGDLYLQDNGIDGLIDSNEPHSPDELNRIAREDIGTTLPDFGFPNSYTTYRTGELVGDEPVRPIVVFQPIPDPLTGLRSEGPHHITFAPPGFPEGLNQGLFIGFHGKFSFGGVNNDENPVVYVDPETGEYFHFIPGQQDGIGHLDGLLATSDSLYVADMVTHGNLFNGPGAGAIYRIKALTPRSPPRLRITPTGSGMILQWSQKLHLEQSDSPAGPWTPVNHPFSPFRVPATDRHKFFRARY